LTTGEERLFSKAVTEMSVAVGTDELGERLLQSAAAVFARQGYDGTKIMDVVREAGLSTGAVYGRFRSKNELLRQAIVRRSATTARLDLEGVDRVADLIAQLAMRTDGPLIDAEAMRLEAYVTARREPEVAQAIAEANDRWRASVAPLVEAAQHDGTVAGGIDPQSVLFLVRILHLGLLLHRGSGLPGPDGDAWHALVERIVSSFGEDRADHADDAGDGPAHAPASAETREDPAQR
jgi:AcrR family transcriptional regulator